VIATSASRGEYAARYLGDDTWHRVTNGQFSVLTHCSGGWSLADKFELADAPPEGAKLCGLCFPAPRPAVRGSRVASFRGMDVHSDDLSDCVHEGDPMPSRLDAVLEETGHPTVSSLSVALLDEVLAKLRGKS
jgi:hypothetical protein